MLAEGTRVTPRSDTPLNWDMAGHVLKADEIRVALRNGDLAAVLDIMRAPSVYPPLYHLSLGTWMAGFGNGDRSLRFYMWTTSILAILGCCIGLRTVKSPAASTAFLFTALVVSGLGQFAAYTQAYMLDAPGTALAVLSLGLLAWHECRPGWRRGAVVAAAILSTILTKYNIGLPLFISLLALGLRALSGGGGRRRIVPLAGIGLAVALGWLSFLIWREAGWRSFLDFSTNRSNSADLTVWARGVEHVRLYCAMNFRGVGAPLLLGLLAVVGVARFRHPFWLVCAAYFSSSLAAIVSHDYLLDRLQMAPGVVFVVLAGFGVIAALELGPSRRPRLAIMGHGAFVLVAGLITATNGPAIAAQLARIYPAENVRLAPVSRYVRELAAQNEQVTLVGTFNEFSAPWASLISRESGQTPPRAGIRSDFGYPLPQQRTGWDSGYDPIYKAALRRQLASMPAGIVAALVPDQGSMWRGGDYNLWNAWKLNYIAALDSCPEMHRISETDFAEADLKVVVYGDSGQRIRFGEGWLEWEDWGRWANSRQAVVYFPATASGETAVFRVAAFGGHSESQTVRVSDNGAAIAEFVVDTPPWRWTDFEVVIPPSDLEEIELVLEFSGIWRASANDGRMLALPVQDIFIR